MSSSSNTFSVINLISYTLHLADNSLILGHKNSEWTAHGPILEQDIAITNIALDLIGQSRNLYQYASELVNKNGIELTYATGKTISEDDLAYLRDVREFKNCLLVERSNGDWAKTVLRQFLFSAYQYFFYQQLQGCKDETLSAIAEKSLKETTYHLRWSADWVIRLGDGTTESRSRMQKALEELWMYTGELFKEAPYEEAARAEGLAVNLKEIESLWTQKVVNVFNEATLEIPNQIAFQTGGKIGLHTEHLGYVLAEMQFLQRAYPGATW